MRLRLDVVEFIPAGLPPHKLGNQIAPAEHRLAMVELAIASNSSFRVSRREIDRAGPSYTVDTLVELRDEVGPDVELYFIIGLDALADISTWEEPARMFTLCRFVAIRRPGFEDLDLHGLSAIIPNAADEIITISAPEFNISATNLRERVASGLPIRYQVPESVEDYIRKHGLYRSEGQHNSRSAHDLRAF